jgi:hypothetical protein
MLASGTGRRTSKVRDREKRECGLGGADILALFA